MVALIGSELDKLGTVRCYKAPVRSTPGGGTFSFNPHYLHDGSLGRCQQAPGAGEKRPTGVLPVDVILAGTAIQDGLDPRLNLLVSQGG